ncbi:MAG: hypothetical protein ACOCW3_02825 [Spirochaetota bacterium]
MKRIVIAGITLLLAVASLGAEPLLNRNDGPLQVTAVAETGFVKVLSHTIKVGEDGTRFDFVKEGGQEIVFPISRFTAELAANDRHTVILLYQPLEIATQVRFDAVRKIDNVDFEEDGGVNVTYGFPFYRVSYLYDFAAAESLELAAGVSLQLRNASVRFVSTDGEQVAVSQDLGPVPILKVRGEYRFPDAAIPGAFLGLEADGFFASSAFINGADYEFSGSIYDVSLRAGFEPTDGVDLFANLRALGGGASGTRPDDAREFWSQSRSGSTDNSLSTLSLSLGARVR